MSTWKNRLIDKALSSYNVKQRYRYQLSDYLKECEDRQRTFEKIMDDNIDELSRFV